MVEENTLDKNHAGLI